VSRLDGKCAIVTGAARGIGLACVDRLICEGAKVVGADIDPDIERIMAERGAKGLTADVGDKSQIETMVSRAVEILGKVDILVSNAGVTAPADFLDYSYEDFERVLRINLHSAFIGGQLVAHHIVARGGTGAIINMSSVNGVLALPNQTAYVTSKGGLNQLTKVMAISLADKGIRVNGVGPGTIVTEMSRARVLATEESRRKILSRTPMGRPGEVEEIASIVAFLASDDASYMTGQTLYADGGRMGLNYTVEVKP
jgi:NAD(P)-dependent dehydrogenase (short-subunit alcohol dehydrogenase family)